MAAIVGVWLIECLWFLCNLIIKPRKLSCEKIFENEVAGGKFDKAVYERTRKVKFHIKSDFGYIISCELLKPNRTSERLKEHKIAILSHGLGCSKYTSLKYVTIFLKRGFKVLIYDQRNHGLSGGACTSMGYYERYDLKKLVDWCYKHFGENCRIITHGESMGAATVLMHLGIDQRVKGVIADCSYSDLKVLLRHQLKQYYHLPKWLIPVESCITYLRTGFWYSEISPIRVISDIETPVMFIHGKRDSFVPAYMSKQMYACKKKNKAIYLVARAKHAESFCKNRIGYEQKVDGFLKKYIKL